MSSTARVEEVPAATVAPTDAVVLSTEEKAPVPEPASEQPGASDQTPKVATTVEPAATVETVVAEPPKEADKAEESPRAGLLKGFQQRLVGVFPKKAEKLVEPKEDKKEEKKQDNSEGKEEKEEEREKETKHRSLSRKRNSLLGGFGIGKKDEKPSPAENAADAASANVDSTKAIENATETVTKTEQPSSPEPASERPALSKRTSIFDSFKSHFAKKEKAEAVTVAKEAEAVSENAPVIPAVGSTEPPAPVAVAVENVIEAAAPAEVKVEKSKFEKRKSSLPFGLGLNKKEKVPTSDEEASEKPLSPFAKLRATVKAKASPKFAAEKKEELTSTSEVKAEQETAPAVPAETEEAKPETTTAAPTAPVVAS